MTSITTGRVEILDALTGEIQTSMEAEGNAFHGYRWRDGNDSCDCNRFLYFMRAKGVDLGDDDDYPCDHGTPRFRVKVFAEDGTLLFDDTESTDAPFQHPGG